MAQNKHERHDQGHRDQRTQAAHSPQHDHMPRQEEAFAREQQAQATRGRGAPAANPRADAEQRDAMAAASIGAQIILDYNSAASLGARGGAGGDIVENQEARDTYLVDLGLDPVSPSGPPPSQQQLAARRQREERQARETAEAPPASPKATRMSSLAAGILTGNEAGGGTPPGGGNGGGGEQPAAPANTTVPQVTQTGNDLNCTTGEWSGEPTSYAYQWKIDGADVGTGGASHTVQAGDGGRSAACVVTATNATGSAAAPASQAVVITEPT